MRCTPSGDRDGALAPWKQADLSRHASIICEPDDAHAATLVACAWKEVGLRVFDISNPTRPVEIAYYKPPGRRTEARPGSGLSIRFSGADRTADCVIQVSRFDRERNRSVHESGQRLTDRAVHGPVPSDEKGFVRVALGETDGVCA